MNQLTFDALKFISEIHHRSHERRVGHELQVVLACLAFFAATSTVRLSTSFDTSFPLFLALVLVAIFAVCCIATKYLSTSAGSNKLDLQKARAADKDVFDFVRQSNCVHISSLSLDNRLEDKPSPSENRYKWEISIVWSGAILSAVLIIVAKA